jgi:hypothetical protein
MNAAQLAFLVTVGLAGVAFILGAGVVARLPRRAFAMLRSAARAET